MYYKNFKLDRFQEDAVGAIEDERSVIVSAPTGAGKTLIAEYAIEKCIKEEKKIIYTSPIKALSNQKFRDFSSDHGDLIGIMTGDVTINPTAPVLIMTTEIFRNTILYEPERFSDVRFIIFDEIHYIHDRERGTVWEESIIFAPREIRLICLSATIPNIRELANWISEIRDEDMEMVTEYHRPVELHHSLYVKGFGESDFSRFSRLDRKRKKSKRKYKAKDYSRGGLDENGVVGVITCREETPCLYFLFSRSDCEKMAEKFAKLDLLRKEERRKIRRIFRSLCRRFDVTDDTKIEKLERLTTRGIAYHHAGMLPSHKEIVERLFTSNLIKLIFTTETFALGVNMPARSVVIGDVKKFNGRKRVYLKSREYHQMAGRAGRRGIDEEGDVYAMIEIGRNKYKPVERIIKGSLERVESQFNLSYSTILNLYPKMGERIYEVCEKSFSNYQLQQATRKKGRSRRNYFNMVEQLRRKIAILKEQGYIKGKRLLKKGKLAAQIYGYEIPVTEIYSKGLLDKLDPHQLNVIFSAIIFEGGRRNDWFAKLKKQVLGKIKHKVIRINNEFRKVEYGHGVRELTKETDFGLAKTVYHWSRGEDFESIGKYSSLSGGDIVRNFRMTNQLLRGLMYALKDWDDKGLCKKLSASMRLINRDEIDAEKQLRAGIE